MSNYSDAALLDAIGILRESKEAPEFRLGNYGALDASLRNREYTIPELPTIKQSERRTTKALYLTDTAVTIGTAASDRGVTLSGEAGDATLVTLTWVPRFFTIKSDHKLFLNSQYTKEQALARLLLSGFKRIYNSLDAYVVTGDTAEGHISVGDKGVDVGGGVSTGTAVGVDATATADLGGASVTTGAGVSVGDQFAVGGGGQATFDDGVEGTFKRVINPNNLEETKSKYYIRRHKVIKNVDQINAVKSGYEKNIYDSPYSLVFYDEETKLGRRNSNTS
jgi:hypothetical protein